MTVHPMLYMCQFGLNLVIGSLTDKAFSWFYEPVDLENQVLVMRILSLLKILQMMYMCQLGLNLIICSGVRVQI